MLTVIKTFQAYTGTCPGTEKVLVEIISIMMVVHVEDMVAVVEVARVPDKDAVKVVYVNMYTI